MTIDLIVLFIVLNVLNVIIQTVKSIATIKCGKFIASVVNAIAYGLYTIVVVYMVCDLPLWFKVLVVALANLIGVYIVKYFEEKKHKDKLWKFECTVDKINNWENIDKILTDHKIPHNYIDIEKYIIFNCYCATQRQSDFVMETFKNVGGKVFASETKV